MDVEEEGEEEDDDDDDDDVEANDVEGETDPKTGRQTLWDPLQSTCTWTFEKSRRALILPGNSQDKCRMPIPRRPFCTSLRSRNAYGHLRRAIWHRNLQEKMSGSDLYRLFISFYLVSICNMGLIQYPVLKDSWG